MRKRSRIEMHVYRGQADAPEIVTVEFLAAMTLDDSATEYWRRAVAKFYGNARVVLADEHSSRSRKKAMTFRTTNKRLVGRAH